jgi:hypothetical protein
MQTCCIEGQFVRNRSTTSLTVSTDPGTYSQGLTSSKDSADDEALARLNIKYLFIFDFGIKSKQSMTN